MIADLKPMMNNFTIRAKIVFKGRLQEISNQYGPSSVIELDLLDASGSPSRVRTLSLSKHLVAGHIHMRAYSTAAVQCDMATAEGKVCAFALRARALEL